MQFKNLVQALYRNYMGIVSCFGVQMIIPMAGIFCYTIELATQFIPPASQVIQVCQDNLQAALILLNK